MKKKIPSALDDYVFKLIFGDQRNIDILEDFLKSVLDLPADEYDHLTIVDPHLKREQKDEKMGILDVKVHTKSGMVIDVEIQVKPASEMRERVMVYAMMMLREQIKRGGKYENVQRVISIIITNFLMLDEEDDYLNSYAFLNKVSGKPFTRMVELLILELPKLPDKKDRPVWPWLKFLKCEREEEFMELVQKNPEVKRPVAEIMEMSDEVRASWIALDRWRWESRPRAIEKAAREDGQKAEKLEIARKMKADGLPAGQICRFTGLSPEEVQKL
jgi:predicted transposase/invertase (TIGR01784 family)